MTCRAIDFNPATTHPASITPENEHYFCIRLVSTTQNKEIYAQAKGNICDEILNLEFRVQKSAFQEMGAFLKSHPLPEFKDAPMPYWVQLWVQKPDHAERRWTNSLPIENSEKVKRIFFTVRTIPLNYSKHMLLSIGSFRQFFPNMKPEKSAFLVRCGSSTKCLQKYLECEPIPYVRPEEIEARIKRENQSD